jgi:tRNA 2-thiouridine synthesizing protein A
MTAPTATLDASGLLCPLPVLRARKAIGALTPGQVLRVIATDPAAAKDMPAFCETTGHRLLASATDADGRLTFDIQRA